MLYEVITWVICRLAVPSLWEWNAKARELGLSGTRFANAHGLPDPGQWSNARDLAQLTARLLRDYPASYNFV